MKVGASCTLFLDEIENRLQDVGFPEKAFAFQVQPQVWQAVFALPMENRKGIRKNALLLENENRKECFYGQKEYRKGIWR
jgi:hypothetical protein